MALKVKKLIALFVGLACFLTVVGSIFVCLNMPVLDMPVVQLFVPHDALSKAEDEFEEIAERFEDASSAYAEEIEDETGMDIDEVSEKIKAPSINTLLAFSELDDLHMEGEVHDVFSIARILLIFMFFNVAVFTLLGALLKKKAFTIVAMVLAFFYLVFFVSIWMTVLYYVLAIGHLVCISLINKELEKTQTEEYVVRV